MEKILRKFLHRDIPKIGVLYGKYRKYKFELQPSINGTRKFYFPFKLKGKQIANRGGWVLKAICRPHNQ